MSDVLEGGAVMVEVKGTKNGKARIYKFSGISRMRGGNRHSGGAGSHNDGKG